MPFASYLPYTQAVECMGDIGHNEASRSENIQKQATAEEIQEAIMRKMDIRKKKAGNISKIRP